MYASGPEVRQYFEDFAAKYELAKYCKTSHEVVNAQWNNKDGYWRVDVRDIKANKTISQECEILVNAAGVLNRPQWPNIPGLHDFKGKLIHSATWDESVELKDKRVGLIGNGCAMFKTVPVSRS